MSHASRLQYLGFQKQDLGLLPGYAEKFYYMFGETYAVDEYGEVWTIPGSVDPGDLFALAKEVPSWERAWNKEFEMAA